MLWNDCTLLNLSTNTKTTSIPTDLRSPSTKSMDTSSQTWEGMGRGCNNQAGLRVWGYLLLTGKPWLDHLLHIFFFIPLQNQSAANLLYVFSTSKWPPIGEPWYSCKRVVISGRFRNWATWVQTNFNINFKFNFSIWNYKFFFLKRQTFNNCN